VCRCAHAAPAGLEYALPVRLNAVSCHESTSNCCCLWIQWKESGEKCPPEQGVQTPLASTVCQASTTIPCMERRQASTTPD